MGLPRNVNLITNRTAKMPGDWKQQTSAAPRQKHVAHKMNKTEAAYARVLDVEQAAGKIYSYAFESVKLWLGGEGVWYTPDFIVQYSDGHIEFHEVKGTKDERPYFRKNGSREKLKIAAGVYGLFFVFAVVWYVKGEGWKREDF